MKPYIITPATNGRNKGMSKKIVVVFMIAVLLLSLASCGSRSDNEVSAGSSGSSNGSAEDQSASAYAPAAATSNSFGQDGYGLSGGGYDGYADVAVPESAPSPSGSADTGIAYDAPQSGGGAVDLSPTSSQLDPNRKITFTASFSINTKNYDADYLRINSLVNQAGGYVAYENSDNSGHGVGRHAWFSVRIPANMFDSVMNGFDGIGEVTNKSKSSEDLTDQYFDTEARIGLLEMRRDRLMDYLENATESKDIIQFERELSSVLYDLDQYQGVRRKISNLVEYATIDVNMYELITPETIGPDGEPLGNRANEAMNMSFIGVRSFLESVAVGFAAAFPVLLLLFVIAACVLGVWKLVLVIRTKYRARRTKE